LANQGAVQLNARESRVKVIKKILAKVEAITMGSGRRPSNLIHL